MKFWALRRMQTPGAIKTAFHKLAMKYHPDRNKSAEAEERFKEIAKAYSILSDPAKRKQYDTDTGYSPLCHSRGWAGFLPACLISWRTTSTWNPQLDTNY